MIYDDTNGVSSVMNEYYTKDSELLEFMKKLPCPLVKKGQYKIVLDEEEYTPEVRYVPLTYTSIRIILYSSRPYSFFIISVGN
jgi:hypothetical protein